MNSQSCDQELINNLIPIQYSLVEGSWLSDIDVHKEIGEVQKDYL
jgi:hypothetical protein